MKEKIHLQIPEIDWKNVKKRAIKMSIGAGLIVGGIITASIYFQHYKWTYQSPILIKIQPPVVIEKIDNKVVSQLPTEVVTEVKVAEPTPTPTPEPVEDNIQKMLNYIHKAESTQGKNNTPGALHLICRNQGKWNELGYGGMDLKICFNSEEEGMAKVGDWLKRHLERFDGDVAKTLCYYNLGEEQINCKYYQEYLGTL